MKDGLAIHLLRFKAMHGWTKRAALHLHLARVIFPTVHGVWRSGIKLKHSCIKSHSQHPSLHVPRSPASGRRFRRRAHFDFPSASRNAPLTQPPSTLVSPFSIQLSKSAIILHFSRYISLHDYIQPLHPYSHSFISLVSHTK
jgi:hypothetical protein